MSVFVIFLYTLAIIPFFKFHTLTILLEAVYNSLCLQETAQDRIYLSSVTFGLKEVSNSYSINLFDAKISLFSSYLKIIAFILSSPSQLLIF